MVIKLLKKLKQLQKLKKILVFQDNQDNLLLGKSKNLFLQPMDKKINILMQENSKKNKIIYTMYQELDL